MDTQLLARALMNQGNTQPESVGGIQGQYTPMQGGADLLRKIMMMQAYKNQMPATPQLQWPRMPQQNPNIPAQTPNLQQILQGPNQEVA